MAAAHRAGLATVLRNPGCRRLFAAQTVSRLDDTLNMVALVMPAFQVTGSAPRSAAW